MDSIVKAEVSIPYEERQDYIKYLIKRRIRKFGQKPFSYLLLSLIIPAGYLIAEYLKRRIISGISGFDWGDIFVAISLWVLFLLLEYSYIKRNAKFFIHKIITKQGDFTIEFNNDGFIARSTKADEESNREYLYSRYSNATEWKDSFMLHAELDKDFIIPKHSITEGTPEMLSALFCEKLGSRFILQI